MEPDVIVMGLLLLLCLLLSGLVKLKTVEITAGFFIQNLAFLLVPLAVMFMRDWKLVVHDLSAIIISIILSTLLVMAVTAKTMDLLQNTRGNQLQKEEKLENGNI